VKVLLDECMPARLRHDLPGHDVRTVAYMGWDSIRNGELLALAATAFDVMVTVDRGIEHEQNQGTLPLAIVLVHAPTNDIDDLRPKMPGVAAALATLRPKTLVHVR
jgi:hypothetical protein